MRIPCPGCTKTLAVADDFAGRRVKCPGCQLVFRVPAGARFTLSLVGADGATLAQGSGSRTVSLSTLVCGRRSLQVRVARVSGSGTFRLALGRP